MPELHPLILALIMLFGSMAGAALWDLVKTLTRKGR